MTERIEPAAESDGVKPMSYLFPPVQEAVIGIKFQQNFTNAEIEAMATKLKRKYPTQSPVFVRNLHINLDSNGAGNLTAKAQEDGGVRCTSEAESAIVILMKNQLTFSKIAPYQGWDNFYNRFCADYKSLHSKNAGRQIARVGIRYINRIDIPVTGDIVSHEDYISMYPHVDSRLGPMSFFDMNTIFEFDDIGCKAVVRVVTSEPVLINYASFVIDIDLSCEKNPPQKIDDLFQKLISMRERKNLIFESCIKDKIRERFSPFR